MMLRTETGGGLISIAVNVCEEVAQERREMRFDEEDLEDQEQQSRYGG